MPDAPQKAHPQKSKTVLGADCHISGELSLDNDALIEGRFKGTLRVSGTLEISASAQITGTIIAGRVRLAGRAEADVIADEAVELLPSAALMGQIFTRELRVAEGGVFQGDVCIGPNAVEAAHESLLAGQSQDDPSAREAAHDHETFDDQPAEVEASADDSIESDEQPASSAPAFTPSAPNVQTDPSTVTAMLQRRRNKVLVTRNGRVTARLPE